MARYRRQVIRTGLGAAVTVSAILVAGSPALGTSQPAMPRMVAPKVTEMSARPSKLGYAGGVVRVTGKVTHASTCTVSASPPLRGFPKTVACSSGSVSIKVLVAKNTSHIARHEKFSLAAKSASTISASITSTVIVEPVFVWSGGPEPPAEGPGDPTGDLTGISCASADYCVAVDSTTGNVLVWDGSAWTWQGTSPEAAESISCPTASFCMASDGTTSFLTFDGSSWATSGPAFSSSDDASWSIGCGSASMCAGGSFSADLAGWNGSEWVSGGELDPAGDAGSRVPTAVTCPPGGAFCLVYDSDGYISRFDGTSFTAPSQPLGTSLDAISCASDAFCLARVGTEQAVFNGTSWSALQPTDVGAVQLGFLFCQSAASCEGIGGSAEAYDGSSWSTGTPMNLSSSATWTDASCTSNEFCMAVSSTGFAVHVDPTQPDLTTTSSVPEPVGGNLSAVSCPTTSWCLAVDSSGQFLLDSSGSWTLGAPADPGVSLTGVSCTSSSFCLAVGSSGDAIEYDGSAWSSPVSVSSASGGLAAVSCVADGPGSSTTVFCAAVDGEGNAYTLDHGSWSTGTNLLGDDALTSVSCVSSAFCVAAGYDGQVVEYDGAWGSATQVIAGEYATSDTIESVSCASESFCMAVDENGDTSAYSGTGWSSPDGPTAPLGLDAVSCFSSGCLAGGSDAWTYSATSGTWAETPSGGEQDTVTALSCPSAAFCIGLYTAAAIEFTNLSYGSADAVDVPGGQPVISCPTSSFCGGFDGAYGYVERDGTWSAPVRLSPPSGSAGVVATPAISCTSAAFCVAVGQGASFIWNGSSWTALDLGLARPVVAVSCVGSTFCIAVGPDAAAEYDGSSWEAIESVSATSVSCVSTEFCMAAGDSLVDFNGSSWTNVAGSTLNVSISTQAVSCTSAQFCIWVGTQTSDVSDVVYGLWDGDRWGQPVIVPSISSDAFPSVSCVSDTFCLADDAVWNGLEWSQQVAVSPGEAVCASTTLCVQPEGTDTLSFDPAGLPLMVDASPHAVLTAVSCSAPGLCAAVDDSGQALTLSDGEWSLDGPVDAEAGFTAISCVSGTTLFCVATDDAGGVFVDDAGTWSLASVLPASDLLAVSCATTTDCVVLGRANGSIWYESFGGSPTALASEGAVPGLHVGEGAYVSCPVTGFCAASDGQDDVDLWQAGTWSEQNTGSVAGPVSCTSTTWCVVVGTSYVTFDGTSWSTPLSDPDPIGVSGLSCVTDEFCVAVDATGSALAYNGTSWTAPVVAADGSQLTSLDCVSLGYCVALGPENGIYAASS